MASVTDFTRRVRTDPFFRTEVTLIALQAMFAACMVALVAVGFSVLYREVVTNLLIGIEESIRSSNTISAGIAIADNLQYVKSQHLVVIGAIIVAVTAVFSYLMTQLALAPTKSALASQKQFIGNIAHEIRTPLSIIKTNAEVALFSSSMPADMRKIFETTIEELDRASNIINNLLTLSSLTRRGQMSFANVDLGPIVESVIAHLSELATKKGITLEYSSSEYRTVWGNASALEQIVTNIVKNAICYTKGVGTVSISVQPDLKGYIDISVEDTGIGIKEEDLHRITEPFYRGDASRTRGEAGSGLGLAIVNELLQAHQGRMTIRSAPGKGTRVVISLPPEKKEDVLHSGAFEEIAVDFTRSR